MNKEMLGKGTFTHLFIQLDNYNIKFNQEILKEKNLIHKQIHAIKHGLNIFKAKHPV